MARPRDLVFVVLGSSIHVVDAYQYSYVGFVLSAVVALILLLAVLCILILVLTWDEWFPKYMLRQGKVKVPREPKNKLISYPNRSFAGSEHGLPSMSGSIRNVDIKPLPRDSPLVISTVGSRFVDSTTSKTDTWIQEIPTPRLEESDQCIQFDDEDEENVIVTEFVSNPADDNVIVSSVGNNVKEVDTKSAESGVTQHQSQPPDESVYIMGSHNHTDNHKLSHLNQPNTTGDFYFGAEDEAVNDVKSDQKHDDEMVLY